MGEREKAKQIILRGIQLDDEIEDDIFCNNLAERYLADDNHEYISFEDALDEAGLTVNDLHD